MHATVSAHPFCTNSAIEARCIFCKILINFALCCEFQAGFPKLIFLNCFSNYLPLFNHFAHTWLKASRIAIEIGLNQFNINQYRHSSNIKISIRKPDLSWFNERRILYDVFRLTYTKLCLSNIILTTVL